MWIFGVGLGLGPGAGSGSSGGGSEGGGEGEGGISGCGLWVGLSCFVGNEWGVVCCLLVCWSRGGLRDV